jgi:hypothetical protein
LAVVPDVLTCWEVKEYRHKEWVSKMFVPYLTFFGTMCVASVISLCVKLHLFVHKFCIRAETRTQRRVSLGGVSVPDRLSKETSVHILRTHFHQHIKERRMMYCYLLGAICEDIPMGK